MLIASANVDFVQGVSPRAERDVTFLRVEGKVFDVHSALREDCRRSLPSTLACVTYYDWRTEALVEDVDLFFEACSERENRGNYRK